MENIRDFAASDKLLTCTKCEQDVHPLSVFPGGVCVDCWAVSPEGRYVPTASEMRQMWGGR